MPTIIVEIFFGEIFSTIANIATVAECLLAFFITIFLWPRFLKQKRLENATENSWRVLALLDTAEEAVISLFWSHKACEINEKQYIIQTTVITALKKLCTGLLVLKKTAPETQSYFNWLQTVIQDNITQSIKNKESYYPQSPYMISNDILIGLNIRPSDTKIPNLTKFEELRQLLTSIAGLYHKNF